MNKQHTDAELKDLRDRLGQCPGPDRTAAADADARWNQLAKPVGSLGELERVITRIAGIQGCADVRLKPRRLAVACADNGIVRRGVAGTPPDITAVMADQIADGKSAVGLMAAMADCELCVHDIGMFRRAASPRVIDSHVADGTADFSNGPAMSIKTARAAIEVGLTVADAAHRDGIRLLATGEMGIGNTSTSAAVAAALTGRDAGELTGRGAGLDDAAFRHKQQIIRQAVHDHALADADPLHVLAAVGGLDIGMLCGVFLGSARHKIPVLVDGVISAAAALLAERIWPGASYAFIATHVSAEPAGSVLLFELGLTPLLQAGMRLGEGTGAMALLPILDMADVLYRDLITFADIGMIPG